MRIFVSMQFLIAEHIEITSKFCIASVEWWSGGAGSYPGKLLPVPGGTLVFGAGPASVFPLHAEHAVKEASPLIRQRCAEGHRHWQSISISGLRARRRTPGLSMWPCLPCGRLQCAAPLSCGGAWQGSLARQLRNGAGATLYISSSWSCPHYH